jgi:hypothetical protein
MVLQVQLQVVILQVVEEGEVQQQMVLVELEEAAPLVILQLLVVQILEVVEELKDLMLLLQTEPMVDLELLLLDTYYNLLLWHITQN